MPRKKLERTTAAVTIPPVHIIPDELHLILRVTDILLENLIEDALQWDDKESSSSGRNKDPAENPGMQKTELSQ